MRKKNKKLKKDIVETELEENIQNMTENCDDTNDFNKMITENKIHASKIRYSDHKKIDTYINLFFNTIQYPKNFPDNEKIIYGIHLTKKNFKTLKKMKN